MLKQTLGQVLKQTGSKVQPESETESEALPLAFRVVIGKSQNQSSVTYRASAFGLGISE